LFKAGDATALAESVLNLLGNRQQWDAFRTAGRQYVETERNWAVSVGRYQAVYERLL